MFLLDTPRNRVLATLLLLVGLAFSLRTLLSWDVVFREQWVCFQGNDAWYHMRLVDSLVLNFPKWPENDPYRAFPSGQPVDVLPLFDFLIAGFAWLLGAGSPSQALLESVGALLPPVLGVLCLPLVYWIGVRLVSPLAGSASRWVAPGIWGQAQSFWNQLRGSNTSLTVAEAVPVLRTQDLDRISLFPLWQEFGLGRRSGPYWPGAEPASFLAHSRQPAFTLVARNFPRAHALHWIWIGQGRGEVSGQPTPRPLPDDSWKNPMQGKGMGIGGRGAAKASAMLRAVTIASATKPLDLVATCALGLEEILASELQALSVPGIESSQGAILFQGNWSDVWRCNWRLRTANRVLVRLGEWPAENGDELALGAGRVVLSRELSWQGITPVQLFSPRLTIALRATSRASRVRDTRWVGLRVKDGIVDAQRERFGRRSSVERDDPVIPLRVWLYRDRATLLLDTSGEPLDRRGYRVESTTAPVRENIAAACVLRSGWEGKGPVLDPMCGSGTLLIEAASVDLGQAPGRLRRKWVFQRFPGYDSALFSRICEEPIPELSETLTLFGIDRSGKAIRAARANLLEAGLLDRAVLKVADAFDFEPPAGPGLLLVNPPYGDRLAEGPDQWRILGDLLKQKYTGWKAVVLAGGKDRGKHIGLRPSFRLPVKNGPLDARILGFDLY